MREQRLGGWVLLLSDKAVNRVATEDVNQFFVQRDERPSYHDNLTRGNPTQCSNELEEVFVCVCVGRR